MKPDRIAELREWAGRWDVDIGEHKNHLDECLDHIELLQAALATEVAVNADYPDVAQRMDRAEAEVKRLQAALATEQARAERLTSSVNAWVSDFANAETRGWNAAVEAQFFVRQEYTDRWDVYVKWPVSEAPSVYGQSRPVASHSSRERAEEAIRALLKPTSKEST